MVAQAWHWRSASFTAMNTQVEVKSYSPDDTPESDCVAAVHGVQRLFRQAEASMSRFAPDSELSRMNRNAGHPHRVSLALYDVVETALWAAGATAGLFDPTRLGDLVHSGYDRSFERMIARPLMPAERSLGPVAPGLPGSPALMRAKHASTPLLARDSAAADPVGREGTVSPDPAGPRYTDIRLHRPRREVTMPAGMQLDLGGIGKGWAVDRASDWLAGQWPFLINAGGDLYAYGAPPDQGGWTVGIVDPWRPEADIATVRLRQRALATSTIARRSWRQGDRLMHHLIDPRTGQPATSDVVSVTVIAARTALAEVYAKAALILGSDAGTAWLNCVPDAAGLLVRTDGRLVYTEGFDRYLEATCDEASLSH